MNREDIGLATNFRPVSCHQFRLRHTRFTDWMIVNHHEDK
jgi:hypothetical protein